MSLKSVDKALEKKLKNVYPNVVFSPLSKALDRSTSEEGFVESFGELVDSNPNDYKVTINENTNETACLGVPPTYEGNTEDRKEKNVVKFPLVAFDRINNPLGTDWAANDPMIRRGRYVIDQGERERTFPVTPMYQIDIISDRRNDVDELWRELIFFLYTDPEVHVEYKTGENKITESYPIKLLDTDNTTDVETFSDVGAVYRQTISLEITNVKMLFKGNSKLIESIPVRILSVKEGGKADE